MLKRIYDWCIAAADKPYALSHWAKDAGHRQLCGDLSGQVIIDFVKKYPKTDTQEPGAA